MTGRRDISGPRARKLANTLAVERVYDPNRQSMLAALQVILGLPRVAAASERGEPNDREDEGGGTVPASL